MSKARRKSKKSPLKQRSRPAPYARIRFVQMIADMTEENPYPVMKIARDGTVLFANQASDPVLIEWDCEVGAKVPANIRKNVTQILDSGMTDVSEVECLSFLFEVRFFLDDYQIMIF